MLTIEADIYEYVRMSYVDKNILGPLVHMCVLVLLMLLCTFKACYLYLGCWCECVTGNGRQCKMYYLAHV